MNSSHCLYLFLFFTTVCRAQDVEIYNGAEFKIDAKTRVDGFVENNDNMLSFVTYSYKLFDTDLSRTELYVLDEQLNYYNSFPIMMPESDEGKLYFRETKKFKNKLYLISRMNTRTGSGIKLFASELDATTGTLGNHFELFGTSKTEERLVERYDFVMSADSGKMALMLEYATKKDEHVRTGFRVFNEDLSVLWENDIVIPGADKYTTITDYMLDNYGNMHIVARIALTKTERDEQGTNVRYRYALYSYFYQENLIKEYDLFLKDNYLSGLTLLQGQNNTIMGSAFYTNENASAGIVGFLNFKLNLENYAIENSQMNDFSDEFLRNFLTEKQIDKGKGVRNFRTRYLFSTSDNGYAFVVEEFDYSIHTSTSYNPQTKMYETRTSERWLFGDIVIFYVDAEGKTKEISIINKRQLASASSSGYSSHGRDGYGTYHPARYWGISAMMKNDVIYLVYNENNKNLTQSEKVYPANNIKKCTTVLCTVSQGQTFSRSALFASRDKASKYKSAIIPRFNYTFSESEQVLVGGAGQFVRFMKIKIRE